MCHAFETKASPINAILNMKRVLKFQVQTWVMSFLGRTLPAVTDYSLTGFTYMHTVKITVKIARSQPGKSISPSTSMLHTAPVAYRCLDRSSQVQTLYTEYQKRFDILRNF